MSNLKTLVWDIETSLSVVSTFQLKTDYIPHQNIITDWNILCGSWKLIGDRKVESSVVKSKTFHDDKHVAAELRDAVMSADIIVHHNGDKFDLKKLNTRLIYHRLAPIAKKLLTVDTLKEARRHFSFMSNRLDYLGTFLKVGKKMKNPSDIWLRALNGEEEALTQLVKYNKQDVLLNESIFNVMRPYIDMPSMKPFSMHEGITCSCGSIRMQKRGFMTTRSGGTYQRHQCQDCGAWHKGDKIK